MMSDGVSAETINGEMRLAGYCGTALENDRRRIGLGGPEDRLSEPRDAWVCCEKTTPIDAQRLSLSRRLIAQRTVIFESSPYNPGFA